MLRTRATSAFGISIILSVIAAIGLASSAPAGAATRATTVPVTMKGVQPMVQVTVGRSQPVAVVLDTGSSGLHIFANAVRTGRGSGVTVDSDPANITYAGGHRFVGVVANAKIRIGTQSTADAVPFALVNDAFCIPSKPTCPAANGIAGFEHSGIFGILGIGMSTSNGPVASPILGMPGTKGETWSLHLNGKSGSLVLGAPMPSSSNAVATIAMKRTGSYGSHALWADNALDLCTTAGTVRVCAPTLFDSGTASFQLWGPQFATVPRSGQVVTPGTPMTVAARPPATPFWSFAAGPAQLDNRVVYRGGTKRFVNAGIEPYFQFTITYSDVAGAIALTA
jgi:hypothetical protein